MADQVARSESLVASTEPLPTDEDRRRVIDLIRSAGGRLGLEEAEARMDAALRASTRADLALLVWDLPDAAAVAPSRPPRVGALQDLAFRLHGSAYVLTNGMLVGIWGLTDSHGLFWPFFPIAGWGIGLAAHGIVSRARQAQRNNRAVRRLERKARVIATTPPSAPPLSVPRREVAVMFVDVVDSTRLNLALGDDDWISVRGRLRDLLLDCYRSSGGSEVNTAGDGFLARFDRAADAVECAVEVQRRLQEQRSSTGFAPPVRIGVHSGPAQEHDGDLLGATVNLASRVTAAADPRQILVTEMVADRLGGRFRLTDGGLRELKGLDRTVHLLVVDWS